MDVIEVLKNNNVRLSTGTRWLTWYDDSWCVMKQEYYQRVQEVLLTDNLDEALKALIEEK